MWAAMRMNRAVAGLLCAVLSLEGSAAERPAKPNLLIILADDLGWQDVKCYEVDEPIPYETPHIDALAKEGILFTQAYMPAPTCAPTRVGILGGTFPARLNKTHVFGGEAPKPWSAAHFRMMDPFYSGRMDVDVVTLAEALKPRGYFTGHIGKWHTAVHHHAFPQPMDQGFDWTSSHLGVSARMRNPDRTGGFATDHTDDPHRLDENGFAHDQTTTDAIEFMKLAGNRPFFTYFCPWYVHYPIHTRTRRLLEKYCERFGIPFPEEDEPMTRPGQNNPYYAAMIEEFDYMVHRVVRFLKETEDPRWPGHKLIENTYVFLTSDNGGMEQHGPETITDNYPLDQGKQWAQEGGVRVPFIAAGPGMPRGVRSDVMVNGLDFYPTLLSLAGADVPEGVELDGCDLTELLHRNPRDPRLVVEKDGTVRDTMYWHFPHGRAMHAAVRKGDWKLLRNFDPSEPEYELYRMYVNGERNDIGEAKDVSSRYPEKRRELEGLLSDWFTEVDAQMPHFNPAFAGPLANKENVPAVLGSGHGEGIAWVEFETGGNRAKVVRVDLLYTLNGGVGHNEEWFRTEAELDAASGNARAVVPAGTTHYLFNLIDENNFLISSIDLEDKSRHRLRKDSEVAPRYAAGAGFAKPAVRPDGKGRPQAADPVRERPSADEASSAESMFARMDTDGDGVVTREEYAGLFIPQFERKDADADGFLTLKEFGPPAAAFERADTDGDGWVSRDEFKAFYAAQFDRRDLDGDGILSLEEMVETSKR